MKSAHNTTLYRKSTNTATIYRQQQTLKQSTDINKQYNTVQTATDTATIYRNQRTI